MINYELNAPLQTLSRAVLVSGFLATCGMWDDHIAWLNEMGCATLTVDNRGCGATVNPPSEFPLSALDLALDILLLLEHVGWNAHPVVLWGASMGGFISLTLAEILLRKNRLSGMYLHATSAGLYPIAIPLGETGWRRILSAMGMAEKSKEDAVKQIVEMSVSKEILSDADAKKKVEDDMLATFDRRFSWSLRTLSQQSPVNGMFSMSPERLKQIGSSGVPIVVHVQTEDKAMPTARQMALAEGLGIEPLLFTGGHIEAMVREPDRLKAAVAKLIQDSRQVALAAPLEFSELERRAMKTVWIEDAVRPSCTLCEKEYECEKWRDVSLF